MKVGLQIPVFTWPEGPAKLGATLAEIARTADTSGFASIWVMDHYFQLEGMLGPADEPMIEGYSALSFIAAVTSKARLGTMVTGVNYRDPGFLVKVVTGLDVLSGGRAWLGIGAGWYEKEALSLGLRFPPTAERFERLEETLQIAKQMFAGDRSPYNGKHYQLAEPINVPGPLSQPTIPILIGGMGEKKTLRLVAQYADACNLFAMPGQDEVLAHKIDVIKRHCADVGRNFDEIEITVLAPAGPLFDGAKVAVSRTLDAFKAWAGLGVQHVIYSNVPEAYTITPLETIAREIIPAAAEL